MGPKRPTKIGPKRPTPETGPKRQRPKRPGRKGIGLKRPVTKVTFEGQMRENSHKLSSSRL